MTDIEPGSGCAEHRTSRRTVLLGLGGLAGGAALTSTVGGVFRQVVLAEAATADNILVVLSLRGGADGLSMVVPYGDPGYARARPTIAVPTRQLLEKDAMFGLHPAFAPAAHLWRQGRMAAVQAVGLPQPNRSHFSAMEQLEDAAPGSTERSGWLNRLIGLDVSTKPWDAVTMGSTTVPTSLHGPEEVFAVRQSATVGLPGAVSGDQAAWKRRSLQAMWGPDRTALGRGGRSALAAVDRFAPLARALPPGGGAVYPQTPLGDVARDTARLLKSGLGVKAVTLDYGDWDMHTGIGTLDYGSMRPHVDELARVLAAFFTDLGTMAGRVTLVTLSEFGRRVEENGANGTDHGYGNVMLVAGGGVRGGRVYGRWPGLAHQQLINGDLAVTRDYRSVLAEILRARFGVGTSTVFPGFRPEASLSLMGA